MTTTGNFDRMTRAWLDLMPDEAPDRVLAGVLEAVAVTPQVRRPWLRGRTRLPGNRLSLIVLTGVAVGLLGLGALAVGSITQPRHDQALPPPSASSDASGMPASLMHVWINAPSTTVEDGLGYGAILSISAANGGTADFAGPDQLIRSAPTMERDGVLRLTSTRATGPCGPTDVGTYRFTLSPGGRHLTLAGDADDCAARLQALPGDWTQTACRPGFNPSVPLVTDCYGDLEAGTYPTRKLNLRDPGATRHGQVTFTVPDGWANAAEESDRFYLLPSTDYANPDSVNFWAGIFLFGHPVAASTGPDCPIVAEPGVGHTPQELVDWIRARPGVRSSAPQSITIDGHAGLWTDIAVDEGVTATCPWTGGATLVPLIETNDSVIGAMDVVQRYVLVDIGGGDTLLIVINTRTAARFDTFVAQAMPVVESLQFH